MLDKEEIPEKWQGNPMLKIRIEKVVVNMSVGKSGEPLERAAGVLEQLVGQRPCRRKAKQTIRNFGIRKGERIACLVTLRKEKGKAFLKKVFQAVNHKIPKKSFDDHGNFSFGIKEHVEIPGTKYSQEIGIHGLGVSVTLGRAGYRVKRRRHARSKIGRGHLLTRDEAIIFINDEFGIEVI